MHHLCCTESCCSIHGAHHTRLACSPLMLRAASSVMLVCFFSLMKVDRFRKSSEILREIGIETETNGATINEKLEGGLRNNCAVAASCLCFLRSTLLNASLAGTCYVRWSPGSSLARLKAQGGAGGGGRVSPKLLLASPLSSWLLLASPGSSWLLLAPPSSSWPWLLLALPGSSWLLLASPGSSWLLLAPPGLPWLPGSSWLLWRLLAFPGSSSFLRIFPNSSLLAPPPT